MSPLITGTVLIGLLGSAPIGDVFFALCSFIMKALGLLPAQEGMAPAGSKSAAEGEAYWAP